MYVGELVADLRRRGITLSVEGGNLRVTPASRLTDTDRELIRAHKPAVLALTMGLGVRPGMLSTELPADWHLLWDERAAIMEYDGGLSRERAEALALADILRLMRDSSQYPKDPACVDSNSP
jgi:hypothetical protein